jgi:hypothetical protein
MVRLERGGSDVVRSTVAVGRFLESSGFLEGNAQVVQRVGEVRMMRAELGFLQVNGLLQQIAGSGDVAGGCRLVGSIEEWLNAHGASPSVSSM